MEILGTLDTILAFATIMLVLSLIVTTLIQAIQSLLRLRGRALRQAIVRLLKGVGVDETDAWRTANQVLSVTTLDAEPKGKGANLGTATSAITKEDIEEVIENLPEDQKGKLNPDPARAADIAFDRIRNSSSMRFGRNIKVVSFACAFVIAFSFHVSTPQLLRQLSVDPALRAKIIAESPKVAEQAKIIIDANDVSENIALQALASFAKKHPNLKTSLEEASGHGGTPEQKVQEISLILEDQPNGDALAADYEATLFDLVRERLRQNVADANKAIDQLARFGIQFWREGNSFYQLNTAQGFGNLIGVLITTLLLMLGAPFWYGFVTRISGIRDMLQKRASPK